MQDLYEMETFLLLGSNKPCDQCEDSFRSRQDKTRAFLDHSDPIKPYHKLGRKNGSRIALNEAQSSVLSKALTSVTNKCKVRLLYKSTFIVIIYYNSLVYFLIRIINFLYLRDLRIHVT